jgi:alkanesulfonate monooxygenase SsuD/methylene tetrahydromethanopterin reductase-like flavin-dependent oxidoreductase (luciferase family)
VVASTRGPFADGTISLGLSAVGSLGSEIVGRLVADARAAVGAGFDGVTISEHHGGFPAYVPSPMLVAAVLLGQLDRGFACAGPSVLPLRTPITAAEDLAWLAAAYPGRVGAGFVAGYHERDFALVGVEYAGRQRAFWDGLVSVVSALGPNSSLSADPAIAELASGGRQVEIVAGVGGPVGVRRAAQSGAGVLLMSLSAPHEAASLVRQYLNAQGSGPVVLIRRVDLDGTVAGLPASMSSWRSAADDHDWLRASDGAVAGGPAELVAKLLVEAVRVSGARALNLRLDAYAADPAQVRPQIERLGSDVLPLVRAELGW